MRRALISLATIGIASLGFTLPTLGQPVGDFVPRVLVEVKQSSLVTTVNHWRRWCCEGDYYDPPAYYPRRLTMHRRPSIHPRPTIHRRSCTRDPSSSRSMCRSPFLTTITFIAAKNRTTNGKVASMNVRGLGTLHQ
jgi:hypothetical protein